MSELREDQAVTSFESLSRLEMIRRVVEERRAEGLTDQELLEGSRGRHDDEASLALHARGGERAYRSEQAESPEAEAAGAAGAFLLRPETMPRNSAVDSLPPRPPTRNPAGQRQKRGIERHRSRSR